MPVQYPGLIPYVRKVAIAIPKIAQAGGFQAKITSAYRSTAKQRKLYALYLAGKMPYTVAPPGQSPHEKGIALDIVSTNQKELVGLMKKLKFTWAGAKDPVHFSLFRFLETGKRKKKKSIVKSVISVASWVPGPVGAVARVASFLPIK